MKQSITLHDVDVPEGYEATGEFRVPRPGEPCLDDHGKLMFWGWNMERHRIILRKIEPTHVKLARSLLEFYGPEPSCPSPQKWCDLSRQIIKEHEEQSK